MHNHPSGEPGPSIADMGLTQRLLEAGSVLQIRVLDHIIVGYDSHHSMEACDQMLAKPSERGERSSRLDWRKIDALETQIYSTEALMDLFASTLTDHLEVAKNRENNRVAAGVAELSRERRVKLRAAFDDVCRAVRVFREAA